MKGIKPLVIISIAAFIFTIGIYKVARDSSVGFNTPATTNAATCEKTAFSVQASFTTTISCITDAAEMYTPDSAAQAQTYRFFQPSSTLTNAAYIKTQNTNLKDNTALSWSVSLNKAATVYIMTRKIPGINAPAWIRNNYTKITNDDFTNLAQFLKRKNNDGLIGLYDIYTRTTGPGTITLQGASDAQTPAYSMYVVAIIPTSNPTSTIQPTNPPQTGACPRPYSADSPWNTPIASNPILDPNSTHYTSLLGDKLTSNVASYTMALYYANASTPTKQVRYSGVYSNVTGPNSLSLQGASTVTITIPDNAQPAAGTDSQVIIWNTSTGDEWGLWQARKNADGSWSAVNGYHYNTNWSGVPPQGFGSRGAGVPYLTGLIRPCEIAQGHIDHAIAFAATAVSSPPVYPATKSDGGVAGAIPEGGYMQLDPSLSDTQLQNQGCRGNCLIIAKALQKYGMYVIDKSGSTKIYAEYEQSAHWNGAITTNTMNPILMNQFRVLKPVQ